MMFLEKYQLQLPAQPYKCFSWESHHTACVYVDLLLCHIDINEYILIN